MNKTMKFLLSLALLIPAVAAAPAESAPPFEIVQAAPGVYAFLKPTALRFNDSNAIIIVNDNDVVVIDTQTLPSDVRAVIAEIRRITDKPVRHLVNTHWHGDHTQGNSVYREAFPGVEFIGHATLLEDIPQRAAVQLKEDNQKLADAIAKAEKRLAGDGDPLSEPERADLQGRVDRSKRRWEELESVKWITPTLTVEEGLTLRRGDRTIRIIHRPGHTRGDLVVFLPAEKILITGDLVDDLPYGGHGVPSQWLASLKSLQDLDFETMITGHGRIHKGKDHLSLITRLVQSIIDQTGEAASSGLDLEAAKEKVDLSEFKSLLVPDAPAERAFDFFMSAAVEQAYREAKGEGLGKP